MTQTARLKRAIQQQREANPALGKPEDVKDEEITRMLEKAIHPDASKIPQIGNVMPHHNKDQPKIYTSEVARSDQKLFKLNDKLESTENSIKDFSKSIETFCGLMNKEMTEITKRLEDLKTKLIDQEKK